MKIHTTIILTLGIFLLSSCATSKHGKWLGEHSSMLNAALSGQQTSEQKLDILAQSFTTLMHQSLNHIDPRKAVGYVKSYSTENQASIDHLLVDINKAYSGMDVMETIAFGLSLSQKPYFKDFIDLFPRFVNKFNQLNSVINLSNKIKSGVMGKVGDKLGLEE